MDITTTLAALWAVFLCLLAIVSGGFGGAIRGGLWGEPIKAAFRRVRLEGFWRSVGDRLLTNGLLCMAAPLALGGAGWAAVALAPFAGWGSAVNGHGLWAQMGRRGDDPPDRGNYIGPLLRTLRITDDTVGKFWRDFAGMLIRGMEYGLAVGLLLWLDGGAWWIAPALGPLTAAAWALAHWLSERGVGWTGWRNGEILGGAVIALTAWAGVVF